MSQELRKKASPLFNSLCYEVMLPWAQYFKIIVVIVLVKNRIFFFFLLLFFLPPFVVPPWVTVPFNICLYNLCLHSFINVMKTKGLQLSLSVHSRAKKGYINMYLPLN